MAIEVFDRIQTLREALRQARRDGRSIGLVPTMGFLHAGHLKLVEASRKAADVTVVSVFVNPTQFGPNEDFEAYPRDFERDLALLSEAGADMVFAPPVEEMYPEPLQTHVAVEPLGNMLIGELRPGHFRGVATVVTKLLNIVQPDSAFFGEKDYQQLQVIRRMAADLSIAARIVGVPTVRESDGLALSSRNVRLAPADREAAPVLARTLDQGESAIAAGSHTPEVALQLMRDTIEAEPRAALQSLDICDAETLQPVERFGERPVVILITARFGGVLLIDQRTVQPAQGRATGIAA